MGYPSGVASFTNKNAGDVIQPSHVNDLQTEVTALESGLLNGLSHKLTANTGLQSSNSTITNLTVSGNSTLASINVTGDSTFSATTTFGTINFSTVVHAPTQPRALVYNSGVQQLADQTETPVTFDSEDFDIGAMHSTASNPSRLSFAASTGLFLLTAHVTFRAGGGGRRMVRFLKNSTVAIGSWVTLNPEASGYGNVVPNVLANQAVAQITSTSDYVEVIAFSSAATTWSLGSTDGSRQLANDFAAVKLW